MISFFVAGNPVAQARPRTFWNDAIRRFVTMNPRKSEEWKQMVSTRAVPYRPREPINYPVRVLLDFYLPRPLGAKGKIWVDVRPDIDNYAKGVLDALQSVSFFKDDAKVVWLECKKLYSQEGRVGVRVSVLGVEEKT